MKDRTTLFLSLAVGTLLTSSVAAFADEVETRRVITDDGVNQTETTTTTVTKNGAPIVVNEVAPEASVSVSSEPGVMLMAIGTRRALLEKMLADEVNKGRISAAQAADLRAQLDRDKAMESTVRSKVTYYNVLPMASDLDAVTARIRTYVPTVELPQPLVVQQKFYISGDKYVRFDDFLKRRFDLENKISTALVNGQLTASQADELRNMLDDVSVKEAAMKSDGNISDHDARVLYTEYDRVGSRVDKFIGSSGVHIH